MHGPACLSNFSRFVYLVEQLNSWPSTAGSSFIIKQSSACIGLNAKELHQTRMRQLVVPYPFWR
jgi:hypothetical protein